MTFLDHDRFCDEIIRQTELLRGHLDGADLSVTVPTCPDWTLRDLAVHVGGAHRWAELLVRTRAADDVPEEQVPGIAGPVGDDPAALDAWLADGAERLVKALRDAGPEAEVWSWAWERNSGFWARRMAHETVVHRADAAGAVGAEYVLAPEVAADAIDEWLEIVRFAQRTEPDDSAAELRGGGRSLHLHATDTAAELNAEWLIEFGDEGFSWRRGHEKATVALRGPLTDVLQVFYRRLPMDSERVEVLGERELLDFWLQRATFG
ncbi:maleylpyruvate isomerase family mycothiol-dependent enzyme [Streptomyces apocyni]|uniref:maleylpyruvate isomerase family mycothiol-dependent enzyme n=1 Tax=Streptomyces apocyni TaxID=2654677 RepID=UPI0012E9AF68|nr:maleylpyruvate isomerase family mycothiol-dependent enzyme [Streptomyces apocyni]